MPDKERDYLTGRVTGHSDEGYGRSEAPLPGLATAMDAVPDLIAYASE
jgi:hypothetical protein